MGRAIAFLRSRLPLRRRFEAEGWDHCASLVVTVRGSGGSVGSWQQQAADPMAFRMDENAIVLSGAPTGKLSMPARAMCNTSTVNINFRRRSFHSSLRNVQYLRRKRKLPPQKFSQQPEKRAVLEAETKTSSSEVLVSTAAACSEGFDPDN